MCKDEGVIKAIEDYVTKKNEFLAKRKEYNAVENKFQDEERKFKKFEETCFNSPKKFRFKQVEDIPSNCAEDCMDKMPNQIAYTEVGRLYVDLMNITQVMSNIYFDMNHYNLKGNVRMDECSIVKKNLFDLIQKISIVKG